MNYHFKESERIQKVLDSLGNEFKENGIVKTVLRQRIEQEKQREIELDIERWEHGMFS